MREREKKYGKLCFMAHYYFHVYIYISFDLICIRSWTFSHQPDKMSTNHSGLGALSELSVCACVRASVEEFILMI